MKNDRILNLLAQGISPVQVVTIVGCSPAYLKSLMEQEDFQAALKEEQALYYQEADEDAVIGNKYLSLEHKILKQIEQQIPNAELRDALKALEVVSNRQEKAKSRHNAPVQGNTVNYTTVNLSLPSHAIPEYTLNTAREVVAINGKPMAPLTGAAVKTLFDGLKNKEVQAISA